MIFKIMEQVEGEQVVKLPNPKALINSFSDEWARGGLLDYREGLAEKGVTFILKYIDRSLIDVVKQAIAADPKNEVRLQNVWKSYVNKYKEEKPFSKRRAYDSLCQIWTTTDSDLWYTARDAGLAYIDVIDNTKSRQDKQEIISMVLAALEKEKGVDQAYDIITEKQEIILNKYEYRESDHSDVVSSSFSTFYYYDVESIVGGIPFNFEQINSSHYSGGWN